MSVYESPQVSASSYVVHVSLTVYVCLQVSTSVYECLRVSSSVCKWLHGSCLSDGIGLSASVYEYLRVSASGYVVHVSLTV